ncbi:DNA-binding protein [Bacillus phage Silence]|nr:DNA-binding protein [Bacillus phage Silence]
MTNMLTTDELAEKLGVSFMTIHRLRKKGLPCVKIGRSVRFDVKDVSEWIEKQKEGK